MTEIFPYDDFESDILSKDSSISHTNYLQKGLEVESVQYDTYLAAQYICGMRPWQLPDSLILYIRGSTPTAKLRSDSFITMHLPSSTNRMTVCITGEPTG